MKKRTGVGRITWMMFTYLAVIAVITAAACYFSYQQQKGELVSVMDMTLLQLENEYQECVENYWDIYLPLFETGEAGVMESYFTEKDELEPMERLELKEMLERMAKRNDRILWMVVFQPERAANYIYYVENNQMQELAGDFPYRDKLETKEKTLEIHGTDFSVEGEECPWGTILVAGGVPMGRGKGTIVAGFSTRRLQEIAGQGHLFPSMSMQIVRQGRKIWCSGEKIPDIQESPVPGKHKVLRESGSIYYVMTGEMTPQGSRIFYTVQYRELFLRAHRYTLLILAFVAGLLGISLVLYRAVMCGINREVGFLKAGLQELGDNHLDYRIHDPFTQPDFRQIADAVNAMAQSLKENIERVYEYQMKQREAEMQELQAKFNPHFLYNSLEMFRAKCYENGDEETADLIAQTAAIFRGFINPKTFIPISEELAFSRRYLALLRARYGDSVEICYDMEPEVMEYGIIRNVFQPVIENYFVHGIDPKRDDNRLCFRGQIADTDTIRIIIEDNGLGMDIGAIDALNRTLQEPITTEKESYGLKNLNQRLRLFYGEGHGILLRQNEEGGLTIEMDIARWTCEKINQ